MSEGALDGLLVVSIDQAVAAPYVASRLADAGARVIKVERPGGDFARDYDTVANGQASYFVWLNRGKESIELDLKKADDAALLHRMIARADIFIQNLAPGAAAALGFGSAELRERHPRLITCDISGYGEDGPARDMRAYDLLIQAETGLAAITGSPEAPGRVGVSVVDIAAGMHALVGILQAVIERQRTGRGKGIQVSLFDCIADWMTVPLLFQEHTGTAPKRVGLNHPSIAPYGNYPTADGPDIVISIQNEREWRRLCETVLDRPRIADRPEFARNTDRVANRPALDTELRAILGALPRAEIIARCKAAKIAFASLNGVAELSSHSQIRRAAMATPNGPLAMVAPPIRESDREPSLRPLPALGEHSAALRKEFSGD
ncbi:CaiB/BaiF CoA transferase family protein [Oceanibacterium hippocampi]|uniref:Formyl-coenzyme A transferase n=1 Tax=Oceanibacterium hippocampi TaxID=745714 RepID=A0A1Y5T7S7_9PROT|nr:CaiB/BaiF CoA-transferase family protein [Oceanibacterium hippocampi]SLN57840.1 Formyl-coenzyme A transferase [Oceanibacterium hippocampi]